MAKTIWTTPWRYDAISVHKLLFPKKGNRNARASGDILDTTVLPAQFVFFSVSTWRPHARTELACTESRPQPNMSQTWPPNTNVGKWLQWCSTSIQNVIKWLNVSWLWHVSFFQSFFTLLTIIEFSRKILLIMKIKLKVKKCLMCFELQIITNTKQHRTFLISSQSLHR